MNANAVLNNVIDMINEGGAFKARYGYSLKWRIGQVCKDLSIFDWWNEYLSVSQLKQMKKFLEVAIDNGFTGYVCFKVGAAGCSNGMWAHKAESTTGYSPDSEALYHSFVNGENYYDYRNADGEWMHDEDGNFRFTLKQVKAAMNA